MHADECGRHEAIVQALREDAWPVALRTHVETCEACAETMLVTRGLLDAARADAALLARPMPRASAILARASARARDERDRASERRMLWPLRLAELTLLASLGAAAPLALHASASASLPIAHLLSPQALIGIAPIVGLIAIGWAWRME